MNHHNIKKHVKHSPAFVFDKNAVISALQKTDALRQASGCKVLYSIKSLSLVPVMQWCLPYVDGFSVSSLFEAKLAYQVLGGRGSIHLTTPGIGPDQVSELNHLCTHISCNSLHQYQLFNQLTDKKAELGLRVNPQRSFLQDERFDPCRPFSKLGVILSELEQVIETAPIAGVHFHTVFASMTFEPLMQSLEAIKASMGSAFKQLRWINLGGGYLYDQIEDAGDFINLVKALKKSFDLEVYIEPGKAIVGQSGYLVTTVIDKFERNGKTICVLDTTVNHHPEVFEYQYQPQLVEHREEGQFNAILAGSTCLAGDLFGEYRFDKPLEMGDRLIFKDAGAYTFVKSNRFNGHNYPALYSCENSTVKFLKSYDFEDYLNYSGWTV
ncbi:carboxynorspermidine decarboxylase [Methylicorpusculum oleiharenae]|uniref:carboxynorspermidine decarboxylase n=1 Tax=Methylicorpusculum oleiharenae TaxID=1338687 RepID=UPI0013595E00|nr:carboxynorspermidine decarboxylase [Methylicorpusculum oleiharenae]MCD2452448.1 carboxynorspermidine decarboxylase [Methylicorpusculum oleiharenae]